MSQSLSVLSGPQLAAAAPIKLNLGCGGAWRVEGWFGLDQKSTSALWQESEEASFLDLDLKKGLPFPTNSVDVIFSSHTLEHFTYEEGVALLFEIYRVLKIGAPLCIIVPDMDLYISNYVHRNSEFLTVPEIIGGQPKDNLADNFLMNFYSDPRFNNTCHKYGYNFENLSSTLHMVGFDSIERVGFHDFSYWPELQKQEFKSPIPHIERFSLSVQCKKLSFNADFREHPAYREARNFAHFRRSEHDLAQHLNSVLMLNERIKAQALREKQVLEESLTPLRGKLERLEREKEALAKENSQMAESRRQLEQQHRRSIEDLRAQLLENENLKKRIDHLSFLSEGLQLENEEERRRLEELHVSNWETLRALQRTRARVASQAGINALAHYLRYGASEGRSPSPLFDPEWYLAHYPDVAKAGADPYFHCLRFGLAEGRQPGPNAHGKLIRPAKQSGGKESASQSLALVNGVPVSNETIRKILERSASAPSEGQEPSITRYSPLISILFPVYNTHSRFLKEALQSIEKQVYPHWELCIVDDGSTNPDCLKILQDAAKKDSRIQLCISPTNEGIARASQRTLEMASGEYVAFVDHDDVLASNGLLEVVYALRQDPTIDMIYTDHADMDDSGVVHSAGLKPAWSPELFLSTNYLVHFKVVRRSLAIDIGGFKDTLHVAQDIGLSCKLAEREAKIHHLPKVLYYWRNHEGSVSIGTSAKPTIEYAAMQTYEESLRRRGTPATIVWPDYFRRNRVGAYKLDFPEQLQKKVAILIFVQNSECDLMRLQRTLQNTRCTPQPDVHIIALESSLKLEISGSFRSHVACTQAAINAVIEQIDCDWIVFLSPSARTLSPAWLTELVGYFAVSPKIGAVGGKVLDESLRVRAGGTLLLKQAVAICGGKPDQSDGAWFNGRLASNVEAVSSRLMATPKSLYLAVGGIPIAEFGDAAGLYYGLQLQIAGYRVVYNPWSKIIDGREEMALANVGQLLRNKFGEAMLCDRYYHPFLSQDTAYVVE